MKKTICDDIAARELFLYASNNQLLYTMYVQPILKNFRRKIKEDTFNARLAPKAFDSCVRDAARLYCRGFGSPNQAYHEMFNAATRRETARMMYEYFEDEI